MIAVWASPASTAAPLTPAERMVCKSVKYCVDITRRHAPDEYDYAVLHGEFVRFGDKGKMALLNMLSAKSETDMRRAQILLAKGRFRFSPDEQRKIAALWPRGDLETHADVMRQALSPLMRARMIDTLSRENPQVRRISREIIAATVAMKMDFPLPPDNYGKIARALLSEPTPALVELLSTFEPAKTAPVFTKLLKSGDSPSVIAAYKKLFEQNPKTAFETLVGTLYDLKDNEPDAAFAISAMLRDRHKSREDGFYLKFAKDIAQDPAMSAMGRLAGFDAILRSGSDVNTPIFDAPDIIMPVLKTALDNLKTLQPYLLNLPRQSKANPDPWLGVFWSALKSDVSNDKLNFIRLVGAFETDGAKIILREALGDKRDWRIIQAAALPLGRMRDKQAVPVLEGLTGHPILAVQVAAFTALDGIKTGQMKGRAFHWFETMKARSSYCEISGTNFKDDAKILPYFQTGLMARYSAPAPLPARRRYLTSAAAAQNGFLAGYDRGEFGGGLLYYDNASGASHLILRNSTHAILPVKKVPLGQYANNFWIFVNSDDSGAEEYAIYKIALDNLEAPIVQAYLPSRPSAISQNGDGLVAISFGQDNQNNYLNPPLFLAPNGAIRQACNAKADMAEALP